MLARNPSSHFEEEFARGSKKHTVKRKPIVILCLRQIPVSYLAVPYESVYESCQILARRRPQWNPIDATFHTVCLIFTQC